MAGSQTDDVPRTPSEPTPQDVLEAMAPCEPYTVHDLMAAFDELDVSRWTMKRRLDSLVEAGEIEKKKHAENRVSFWLNSE